MTTNNIPSHLEASLHAKPLHKVKRAAIIPSKGIGDALLMMIAAKALKKQDIEVTIFHPHLHQLQAWFVGQHFKSHYTLEELDKFDLVIAENDNSNTITELITYAKNNDNLVVSIFYPTYKKGKHAPLNANDFVFDSTKPMAHNIAQASAKLLSLDTEDTDNGLIVQNDLTHRLHQQRVLLHPTSSSKEKNWSYLRFLKLAKKLKNKGFDPIIVLSKEEAKDDLWQEQKIKIQAFDHLSDLATYIYQSGYLIGNDSLLGHLASNLNIPTIIIADNPVRMQLWRPGWLQGDVITPPKWIPNFKPFRFKSKQWRFWIPTSYVLKRFHLLRHRY
jgi:hypothetical protein